MFGKKAGLFTVLAVSLMLFGGCGNAGANLGGTRNGSNGSYNGYNTGTYSSGGTGYWDGYGINSAYNGTGYNGANYNTYGVNGNTLGQNMRNTWDDLTGTNRTTTNTNTNGNTNKTAR
ncbi:MAG: hypothetical protein MR278_07595 [Bacteroidales bacterium]|nr:hypothetical protein [Anaerotignum sp.]MCI5679823.1 hypothetical protein [Bacteroidales bacterium]MDY3925819.1 hypothetical protein [Anaerotignum sp.]